MVRLAILVFVLLLGSMTAFEFAPARADAAAADLDAPTYSAYLPSTYTPDHPWPLLICFDPLRRAAVPIELFREAAERHGFIVVSSGAYDSADSVGQSIEGVAALWNDVISRYPIDLDRIVAAGFSGGGRMCWLLEQMTQGVDLAGIIEVGAGLPRRDVLDGWDPGLAYYGLVGQTDFNFYEMRWLDKELAHRKILHRVVTFEGGHEWPSPSFCSEALDWMQIVAMQRGRAPADSQLIENVFARDLTGIVVAEEAGRLDEAHDRAASTVATFRGLRDIGVAQAAFDRLEHDNRCAAQLHARIERERSAEERIAEALDALDDVRLARTVFERPSSMQLAARVDLPALMMMKDSKDPEERLEGIRVLEAIFVRAADPMPHELLRRGDAEGAAILLRLAVEIHPERPTPWYDLSCAYARSDRPQDALRALARAIDSGFRDAALMRSDPDLEALRPDSVYVRLLHRITTN
jgi:predicted esterase